MDQKPQILIVEDDERLLMSACQVLETAGFEPVCARNSREAARLAAERPFDLALVEENLADAGEVCRQIKAAQPTFVVMLQGSDSPSEELAKGADGLIISPVTDRELLAQVRAYLRIQQTQAALRASEARFLSFVDQASEGILMLDEQGVIVEFNSAMEQITGLPRQQVVGQPAWDFQFQLVLENHRMPAFYNRIKARWLEAIHTGQSPMFGNPVGAIFQRADGSQRFVSQSLFPIKTEAGFRIGSIARDITEQKQAEEALRESEANFRGVFENNTVGLYRTTPEGRILMANPALLHMLGIEDFSGLAQRNLEGDYFNSSYPRSAFKQQIESQGEVKGLESAWKKEDGSYVYVLESARVIYDQAGEALYYEGTVEDITERKKAEQALEWERYLMNSLMDNFPDTIYFKDAQSHIIRYNQGFARHFG